MAIPLIDQDGGLRMVKGLQDEPAGLEMNICFLCFLVENRVSVHLVLLTWTPSKNDLDPPVRMTCIPG